MCLNFQNDNPNHWDPWIVLEAVNFRALARRTLALYKDAKRKLVWARGPTKILSGGTDIVWYRERIAPQNAFRGRQPASPFGVVERRGHVSLQRASGGNNSDPGQGCS